MSSSSSLSSHSLFPFSLPTLQLNKTKIYIKLEETTGKKKIASKMIDRKNAWTTCYWTIHAYRPANLSALRLTQTRIDVSLFLNKLCRIFCTPLFLFLNGALYVRQEPNPDPNLKSHPIMNSSTIFLNNGMSTVHSSAFEVPLRQSCVGESDCCCWFLSMGVRVGSQIASVHSRCSYWRNPSPFYSAGVLVE